MELRALDRALPERPPAQLAPQRLLAFEGRYRGAARRLHRGGDARSRSGSRVDAPSSRSKRRVESAKLEGGDPRCVKERRSRALSSKTTAAPPPRKKGSEPAPASAAGERARDPERTRASLLDAAEEEFGARGFHGARVRSIVDAAGCNDRMLYHYFGDKEGLYRAVIERGLSITAAGVGEAMADADSSDVVALFERVLHALAAAFGDRPSFTRLLVHEALNDFRSFPT